MNTNGGRWQNFQANFTKYAGKIAANKLLLTLRDSFIIVAATSMIAGFAIMIQNVFVDPTNGLVFGKQGFGLGKMIAGSWSAWEKSGLFNGLTSTGNLIGLVSNGSLNTFAVLLVVIFSHTFSRKYFPKSKEHMTSVLYALGAFFICMPWKFQYTPTDSKKAIDVLNYMDTSFFGTKGVFAALLISGFAVWIYNKILERNITIKMPDSVPPAVARSFESLIPGVCTMGVFIILTGISTTFTSETMPELLLTLLQKPALAISGTGLFAFVSQTTWSLLQWFGIHPTSIWGPIFGLTWNINDTQNMLGQAHHIYSSLFMNFSTIAAGSCSVSPVLALMLFSKRVAAKKISKIAIMPAIFNISEPITFGLPIILNPLYFIPWVVAQPLAFYIGYFFIKIGFIAPIVNNVPWTVPTLISGLLYTGSIKGLIVQAIIVVATTAIYIPFIQVDNKLNPDIDKKISATKADPKLAE
ncbi:PTS sugar transporter subunit IIC [Lactiplantibacillus mudanjiangensis]|uniref:Permease IIC component n=1 Tax=Lactiplantibacillus mudanjiangensis TaxID=1296538 RepID=A0A660E9Z2_9LACO|nr:PTS transporter subunit EIIC [Lactiplantibacillus mudanjiangensis]VDG19093.1 PTS lactose transporter subunit IIC [Lactobacillus pentosus] [Lactiplantibacillus mudanjiangensis]VDG23204.1 PTS lactose transporter subunit IIC [Lactobacillus pentosus] [Lactiplantibacillus mudanjiangensis]VDG29870.1 PTS lactose transporter subunit IIC [Lactobacillus pentosus] [Lactiplantibacillus mudanjiangensis]VDG33168.1 PTS lactose transporter subunit IIC [Lactobacillus pentosus] [Lactiplantibacillus mudanjiang